MTGGQRSGAANTGKGRNGVEHDGPDLIARGAVDEYTLASPATRFGFASLIGWAPFTLLGAAGFAMLCAILSLAPCYFLYRIAIALFTAQPDVVLVRQLATDALLVLLLRFVLMSVSHCLAHLGAFSVLYRLRLALVARLTRVPMGFFTRQPSSSIRRVVLGDTGAMEGFLAHVLPDASAAFATSIAAAILLCTVDWRLGLAALSPLPLALLTQAWLMRQSARQMHEWHALQAGVAAQLLAFLRGVSVVKVFGLTSTSFGRLAHTIEAASVWVSRYAARAAAGWAIFTVLLSSGLLVVAPLGAWLHGRGEVDAATVVLFLLATPMVLQPLLRLTYAFGEQARRQQGLARIDGMLRAPLLDERHVQAAPPRNVAHDIRFEQVDFDYETGYSASECGAPQPATGVAAGRSNDETAPACGASRPSDVTRVLHDVSFHARAGKLTAVVGASGAGKSTVLRLLPRFFDTSAGSIRVAGLDVTQWPLDSLLARIAIVFQDVFLFPGTVRDNLLLACPAATPAKLESACRAACAHDFILQLPQGYDTPLGERGARLSGGERQRLSIARALLKDAPILLLDEATAYADAENAWLIQQALARACAGRTVLMVAHRLSTVRHADCIVVLDAGRVVGQGRHEDLLRDCPRYQSLWADHQHARSWQLQGVPA